jgi:uncharacterized protein (DUF1501 family)
MQTSVPEALDFHSETAATQEMYGIHTPESREFGMQLLAARRLVERGVRFIQIQHGAGGAGAWDAHGGLKANHEKNAASVDRPIAGLIQDLKRRGLLDETIVIFATEFGRTPGSQGAMAAITTSMASRSGWRAAACAGASCTAQPTRSASTPWTALTT